MSLEKSTLVALQDQAEYLGAILEAIKGFDPQITVNIPKQAEFKFPEIKLPEIKIPQIKVPDIKMPDYPKPEPKWDSIEGEITERDINGYVRKFRFTRIKK